MINVNVGHAAVVCVAMGAAALSLTACSSNTAKGGAPSSASASVASVAATSPTAVTATTSVVPTSTAPATTGGGAASAAPNPCMLVTAADVSAATGSSVSAGIHQRAGLYDACIYGSGPSLVILVRTIDRTTFDMSAKANPGGAIPVSGVGDDAYNASGALLVWQAGTEIGIHVESGSGDPLTTEKKLATAAVARL